MLAIVIPYYKVKYFRETLFSLANQTDKRFKVYIGDDASLNNPEHVLKNFEGSFDYKYYRFEKNLGSEYLTKQWERCIDLTADEAWIMILGDDDVLGETVVEEFYKGLERPNFASNVIRCATIVIDERNKTYSDLFTHPELETGIEFSIRKLKHETRSSLSEYIFKKEAYLRHKFTHFPSAFYSDDKAWLDFSEEKKILSLNEAAVYIRISDVSLSGTVKMRLLRESEYYYLRWLVRTKLNLFNKPDRIFILKMLAHSFLCNDVDDISEWLSLYVNYLKNFQIGEFLRFQRKLIRMLAMKIFKYN